MISKFKGMKLDAKRQQRPFSPPYDIKTVVFRKFIIHEIILDSSLTSGGDTLTCGECRKDFKLQVKILFYIFLFHESFYWAGSLNHWVLPMPLPDN